MLLPLPKTCDTGPQVKTYITNWDREQGARSLAVGSRMAEIRGRMPDVCLRPLYSAPRPLSGKRPLYSSNNSNNHFKILMISTISMYKDFNNFSLFLFFSKSSPRARLRLLPSSTLQLDETFAYVHVFSRILAYSRLTADNYLRTATDNGPLTTDNPAVTLPGNGQPLAFDATIRPSKIAIDS